MNNFERVVQMKFDELEEMLLAGKITEEEHDALAREIEKELLRQECENAVKLINGIDRVTALEKQK